MQRHTILFATFAFVLTVTLIAAQQQQLSVAPQPLAIIPANGTVHVFCGQVDQDFDGTQDPEDRPPSWWQIDAANHYILSQTELPWGSLPFPARIAVDSIHNRLYLPAVDSILVYDLTTSSLLQTLPISGPIRSVSIDIPTQSLLLCRNYGQDSAIVVAYDLTSGQQQQVFYTDSIDFVQTALAVHLRSGIRLIAILFEGNFGQTDSRLVLIYPDHTKILDIGGLGNHIAAFGDTLLVTMNGSHQIHLVDLNTGTIVRTIATETEGYNGPRESILWQQSIITSTYNSDIRIFDVSTGELQHTLDPNGKPEGIAVIHNTLWVANAFRRNSYTYDSTIAIIALPTTSIGWKSAQSSAPIQLVIDPQTSTIFCKAERPVTARNLRVHTLDGRLLHTQSALTLTNDWHPLLPALSLSAGPLFIQLEIEQQQYQWLIPLRPQ